MVIKKVRESSAVFECKNCDYITNRKSQYSRHLYTTKHKMVTNGNNLVPKGSSTTYECGCGKTYKHLSGLSRHNKKCNYEEKIEEKEEDKQNVDYEKIINNLLTQNNEMLDKLLKKDEQLDKIIPLIGNNNNNTQFNINVFLNEDCKDALNIKDFISSLQLQLKDLDNTGKVGFVEGTSKIFIDGLNKLEITKRPIHCSDIKNETLYIKDNDIWEKENKNKDKMKSAIDEITEQNMKQIPEWVKGNPKFANDEEYLKVISNIMNVMDNNNQNKEKEQIINNVAKETLIDE